jgi:NAD(P)-dependent dehydrogenase (short-subunit alcohol dehydrogenase family)
VTHETCRAVIDIKLSGSFYMVQACLPFLQKADGASIVNIASGAGLLPNGKGLAAYAASKGGVVALTKALASDLAPGIRVNCLCPGMVDTPMADGHRAGVVNYALKRIADPAEIASAILFLMGRDGSFVTGSHWPSMAGARFTDVRGGKAWPRQAFASTIPARAARKTVGSGSRLARSRRPACRMGGCCRMT